MNHKIKKPFRLTIISDAFVPGAFLIDYLYGIIAGTQTNTVGLFLSFLAVNLLSLSACYGLRAAFARQPSMAWTRGTTLLTVLLELIACALMIILHPLVDKCHLTMNTSVIIAGSLLNIEHTFYEYCFAAGKRGLASAGHAAAALLLSTALIVSATNGQWLLTGAALAALIMASAAICSGLFAHPRINAEIIKRAPGSILRTALYPALSIFVYRLGTLGQLPTALGLGSESPVSYLPSMNNLHHLTSGLIAGFFAGWLLQCLCRTPFRRSGVECRPMNIALMCIAIPSLLAWGACICPLMMLVAKNTPHLTGLFAAIPGFCAMLILSCACVFLLYGRIEPKESDVI